MNIQFPEGMSKKQGEAGRNTVPSCFMQFLSSAVITLGALGRLLFLRRLGRLVRLIFLRLLICFDLLIFLAWFGPLIAGTRWRRGRNPAFSPLTRHPDPVTVIVAWPPGKTNLNPRPPMPDYPPSPDIPMAG